MERFRDDDLAATLLALRPTPSPEFAAELDQRAAAGFPRWRENSSGWERLLEWARSLRPRQVLLPAGATAVAAIVIATALVGTGSDNPVQPQSGLLSDVSRPAVDPFGPERQAQPPAESSAPAAAAESAGGSEEAEEELSVPESGGSSLEGVGTAAHRKVERSAEMVLGAEPGEVGDQAGKVFEAVHANHGIVLSSSIRDGAEGAAGARFELLIPSGRLSDALADFSEIGEVRSRHEATADITAPTVTVAEQLRDSRARIDGLLAQLAAAETESEMEAVEAELQVERKRSATLRAQLAKLDRRASLSRVQVRIETGASPAPGADDSSWGIGDALHDAGRILGIAAGVTLIGLAVLGPIALIGLLLWLAQRAWVRRGRERALG